MRSTTNAPTSQNGRRSTGTAANNNTGNSGSQYALCALGVGLVALGIVMIVWSVVPAEPSGNSSLSPDPDPGGKKQKASSVAFVLVGCGVAVLLLSMCLGMRNKQREQQFLQQQQQEQNQAAQTDAQTAEEQARRYAVPSYEEAVGSGQYPVTQSNLRSSASQLPSYDDLVTVDGLRYESEGPGAASPTAAAVIPEPPASANRRLGKNKLLPIKIRRIKSEKLHVKDGDVPHAPTQISIEPLTPPPQYEDKVPPL